MQFLKGPQANKKGFTLIEIITVIVLLGIMGVMGSEIITTSFKGFSQTDATMELFEEGKLALMRMEREIHHMVPNAIDVPSGGSTMTFGLIDVNTLSSTTTLLTGQYEPIGNSAKIRDLSLNPLTGGLLSIYNTSWNDFASTTHITERKIYNITGSGTPPGSMLLHKNIIDGHSATKRYYPVQKAVKYNLNGAVLERSEATVTWDSDFANNFGTAYPLLSHIQSGSLSFNYSPPSLTNNALVRVNFTLAHKGITLDFHKEIQVRNVP
jgi:MSHA biogenesis protein MshO